MLTLRENIVVLIICRDFSLRFLNFWQNSSANDKKDNVPRKNDVWPSQNKWRKKKNDKQKMTREMNWKKRTKQTTKKWQQQWQLKKKGNENHNYDQLCVYILYTYTNIIYIISTFDPHPMAEEKKTIHQSPCCMVGVHNPWGLKLPLVFTSNYST